MARREVVDIYIMYWNEDFAQIMELKNVRLLNMLISYIG